MKVVHRKLLSLAGSSSSSASSRRVAFAMWTLIFFAAITVFSLGRYSIYLSAPSSSLSGISVGKQQRSGVDDDERMKSSAAQSSAAVDNVAGGCQYPLDMADDEGVDDVDDGEARRPTRAHGEIDEMEEDDDEKDRTFDGVRHFVDKCIVQGNDRVEIISRQKLDKSMGKKGKRLTVVEHRGIDHDGAGVAFLVRDVCALGHFPKDLAHMHNWQVHVQESSSSATAGEQEQQGGGDGGNGDGDSNDVVIAGEDDKRHRLQRLAAAPEWLRKFSGEIGTVVVGHRCATRDARRPFNKRTPVFHNVLIHWVRAITGRFDLLSRSGDREDDEDNTQSPQSPPLRISNKTSAKSYRRTLAPPKDVHFYEDFEDEAHCYDHILEREERWRWFSTPHAAHSFRKRMWQYIGANYSHKRHHRLTVPFDKQRKLQILVLHRDEDRHFDERRVVQFLREKFGKVADVRYEQYDAPPNPKKITPENNITVPHHKDQLLQLFDTDILIAAHGAALSNVVVMQPGAVVIELFPHNFRYYMYEELCRVMSLNYVAYESETVFPSGCCKQVRWQHEGASAVAPGTVNSGVASQDMDVMFALNGKRDCKKCSILVKDETWYQLVKNSMASIWLRNSRLSQVHHFDVRR